MAETRVRKNESIDAHFVASRDHSLKKERWLRLKSVSTTKNLVLSVRRNLKQQENVSSKEVRGCIH